MADIHMTLTLFHSTRSPFVRKVVVAAMESRQIDDLDIVPADPHGVDVALRDANAISKIPALITEDGVALPESDLICLYLDERSGGRLIPASGRARWLTLRRQALADGFMEAAVDRRSEALRADGARSEAELGRLMDRMLRCLDAIEREAADGVPGPVDLGAVAAACACGYADFRYPDLGWREGRPRLAAFFQDYDRRPSMQATRLFDP